MQWEAGLGGRLGRLGHFDVSRKPRCVCALVPGGLCLDDEPPFHYAVMEEWPTIHSQPRPSLPPKYDPRLLRMQLHAAVVSGIGLPLLSSGAMRASPNYATLTESSVPFLSGSVTEINPLPGSRINSRKSGSA